MLIKDKAQQKGRLAEAAFLYACARYNWGIVTPFLTPLTYDFAIFMSQEAGWVTVQCKYAGRHRRRQVSGRSVVSLRRNKNQFYKEGDFDLLFVYCGETHNGWLIPKCRLQGKGEITPAHKRFDEYRIL